MMQHRWIVCLVSALAAMSAATAQETASANQAPSNAFKRQLNEKMDWGTYRFLPNKENVPGVQQLRLVQDDAQDYMVSKIYDLKFVQANDVTPFLLGIVMRYNINSTVNNIEYGANNSQMLTVTCPIAMMPYVDDFIKKIDRNIQVDGKTPGDIIKGTGITRAVYRPKYRSGEDIVNVMVNSVIGEGVYSSMYAWDANSNQIYWKDNSSNTQYNFQFLSWIDRPVPQVTFSFVLYEVRDSTLRDIGIEYLAWKNGPGLNIFQAGFDVFSVSSFGSAALQAMSGPVGGFLTAPQFDASFVRLLQQTGNAKVTNSATITVCNSDTKVSELYFNPQFQNIVKSNNDQTSVTTDSLGLTAGMNQLYVKLSAPIVNLHYGLSQPGYPANEEFSMNPYQTGDYAKLPGTVFFGYDIQSANVVERNNVGTELVETSEIGGNTLIELGKEVKLAEWTLDQKVSQRIGVPWLMDIPILGYAFSTETTTVEKTHFYLTVTATMLNTAVPLPRDVSVGEMLKFK